MAQQSNARKNTGIARTPVAPRPHSHKILEALLLLSALGILCVLFSFFALELRGISEHAFGFGSDTAAASSQEEISSTPPRVEAQVIGSSLLISEVDDAGNATKILYSSDLSDDIADFTLFAVPQTGYRGYIYVRPIIDGILHSLTVYPLEAATGSLKAATLNISADSFVLSGDETVVGALDEYTLTLYAIEDGNALATGTVPEDWRPYVRDETAALTLSENSCLSLTLSLPPAELAPFPEICP